MDAGEDRVAHARRPILTDAPACGTPIGSNNPAAVEATASRRSPGQKLRVVEDNDPRLGRRSRITIWRSTFGSSGPALGSSSSSASGFIASTLASATRQRCPLESLFVAPLARSASARRRLVRHRRDRPRRGRQRGPAPPPPRARRACREASSLLLPLAFASAPAACRASKAFVYPAEEMGSGASR